MPDQRKAGPAVVVTTLRVECRAPAPRPKGDCRSWRSPAPRRDSKGNPSWPDGARRESEEKAGAVAGPAQAPVCASPPSRCPSTARRPDLRASRSDRKHAPGSRPRIRATGSTPIALARTAEAENGFRKATGQARPNCRCKSPVFAVAIEIGHQLLEGEPRHRLARRGPVGAPYRWPDPPLAHAALDNRLRLSPRRHDLGDDAITVGDDDRLAGRRQPDVFAQPVF